MEFPLQRINTVAGSSCCRPVFGRVSALSLSCTGHDEPGQRDRSRDSRRRPFHWLQHQLKTANFSRFSSLRQAFTHYDRVGTVSSPWTHLDIYSLSFRDNRKIP